MLTISTLKIRERRHLAKRKWRSWLKERSLKWRKIHRNKRTQEHLTTSAKTANSTWHHINVTSCHTFPEQEWCLTWEVNTMPVWQHRWKDQVHEIFKKNQSIQSQGYHLFCLACREHSMTSHWERAPSSFTRDITKRIYLLYKAGKFPSHEKSQGKRLCLLQTESHELEFYLLSSCFGILTPLANDFTPSCSWHHWMLNISDSI